MKKHLDWDHLRIFLTSYRAGSLRGAAEQLGVNHATIRRAIEGLEDRLGTTVFNRSSGGLTLTQPGEMLIDHAEEMERQTSRISRKLFGLDAEPSGKVRVSVPQSFAQGFLAEILAGFTEEFPDIQVEVIATNKISNLSKSEADVSIRVAHEVEDDVVGRRLLRYVTGAFATPEYLDRHPDLTIGDGTGTHWIGWGSNSDWIRSTPFPNAGSRHALPEIFMQLAAASQHLGMAWVPCFLGDSTPGLVRVPGVQVKPDRSLWLLLHSDLRKSARVRAFVDFTAEAIRKRREAFTT